MASPDPDLTDVFKILYDGDEWDDEEEEEILVPFGSSELVATDQAEVEAANGVEVVDDDLTTPPRRKYTRAQFASAIDSLIQAGPSKFSKRQRIYPSPPRPQTCYSSLIPLPPIPSSSKTSYSPFSPFPFLSRLRTFQPSLYPSLISVELSPVKAALHGWYVDGRNTLTCSCGSRWSVGGILDISDQRVRVEVTKRLAQGLVSRHKSGCAWKVQHSPDKLHSELRNLLHPPVASSLGSLASGLDRDCDLLSSVRLKHPLSKQQLDNLSRTLSRYGLPDDSDEISYPTEPLDISPNAAILALFAWYPHFSTSTNCISRSPPSKPTDIVSCRICQRRVGLWSFKSKPSPSSINTGVEKSGAQRFFDVEGEHTSWCPIRGDWWKNLPWLDQAGREQGVISREVLKGLITISERPSKRWRKL